MSLSYSDIHNKLQMARILINQHNHVRAKSMLQEVLQADVNNTDALGLLTLCESAMGNLVKAEDIALSALSIDAGDAYLHYVLAHNYHRMHEHQKSLKAIDEAVRIEPEEPTYLCLKAIDEVNIDRYDLARITINRVLSRNANHANALRISAIVSSSQGHNGTAVEEIDRSLSQNPENHLTYLDKAAILMDQGKFEEARGLIQNALRLQPNEERGKDFMLKVLRHNVPVVGNMVAKGFQKRIWLGIGAGRVIASLLLTRGVSLFFPIFWGAWHAWCAFTAVVFESCISFHPSHRFLLSPVAFRYARAAAVAVIAAAVLLVLSIASDYAVLWKLWWYVLIMIPVMGTWYRLQTPKGRRNNLIAITVLVAIVSYAFSATELPVVFILSSFFFFSGFFVMFSFRLFGD